MAVIRAFAALLAIAVLTPFAQAKTNVNPSSKNPDQFICGTTPERTPAAIALSRYNRLRRPQALTYTEEATTNDIGNIAVLEDDGTVLTPPNRFDLTDKMITFTPAGNNAYSVITQNGSFDDGAGSASDVRLSDDDSTEIQLPFSFTFYGTRYSSVFLNSDGNLTFTAGDSESTERNLFRIMSGVPRIAPFFDDLNPTGLARITVEKLSDRALFTWIEVGEWITNGSRGRNTFQAVIRSNGVVTFNYRTLDATHGIVAISPGKAANGENSLIDFAGQATSTTLRGLIGEIFANTLTMDEVQAVQIFYRTHPDSYDGIVLLADFNIVLPNGAYAFAMRIRNDVRGISNVGPGTYDYGAEFGSKQRLSVVLNMGDLSRFPGDPYQQFLGQNSALSIMGQEFGHRWLAFLDAGSPSMLGRDRSHWSFLMNSSASVVEGNEIEDLGDGRFRTVRAVERYGPLDQYVMGLRPASEVPSWFVVADPVLPATFPAGFPQSCRTADALPSCGPFVGLTFSGKRRDVTIDEIISIAGRRTPSYEQAQKDFRLAFVLITQKGQAPRPYSMEQVDAFRKEWEKFFNQAVDGRGTMSTAIVYFPPQITAISPAVAPVRGGGTITISGSGFQPDATVTIGGVAATATFRDSSTLIVTVPARTEGSGAVSVVVQNPRDGQTATLPFGLTYIPNTVTEVRTALTANASRHLETAGANPSVQVGYAVLDSAFGISVFQSRSGSDIRSEAAVPAAVIGTSFRVYAERTDRTSTGLAIVNTASTATVVVQLSDNRQTTIQIPARGQRSQFIHELFPDIGTSFSGTASVTSNVPVGVVALRGSLNLANEFIIATVPLSSGSAATETAVFPQIADGSGFVTELLLLNPGTTTISGSLEFSFSVTTSDRGTNARFTYEIPARGSWKLRTLGARPDVQVGYASVVPATGSVTPVATAILKQMTGGNLNFEAGVPATRAVSRGVMFGVRSGALRSVLAISGNSSVRLTAYRTDGTAAAPATAITVTGHKAAFFDELISQLPSNFEGTVVLEASSPVYVITLRTLVNASGAFLMTPMPVIDATQPAPGTSYFPQLVDGGNFTTEYLLLNLSAASARIQFFTSEGAAMPLSLR